MVIFGGITYNPPGDLNDAWSFDLGGSTGWTPLVPPGIWPSPRYSFACAYDPAHKTMEIFGGGPYLRDVWELPLGDTTTTAVLLARFDARAVSGGIEVRWEFGDPGRIAESWIVRAANGAGPWVEAALDRRREGESEIATDRTVTDGETRFYRLVARERGGALLHFGPVSATAGVTPVRASLDAPSPNPARGAVQLGFTLPAPAVIRLSIFDVAGREVATLLDGEQRAGRFAVTWSGEFGTGGAARPGLYFARLRTTHGTLMRRIAIAR
jgi:hypothetical protein